MNLFPERAWETFLKLVPSNSTMYMLCLTIWENMFLIFFFPLRLKILSLLIKEISSILSSSHVALIFSNESHEIEKKSQEDGQHFTVVYRLWWQLDFDRYIVIQLQNKWRGCLTATYTTNTAEVAPSGLANTIGINCQNRDSKQRRHASARNNTF